MKVKLKKPRRLTSDAIYWHRSEPFYVNPRGVLVHRVRDVCTIFIHGQKRHNAVHYVCGNQNCFPLGSERELLVARPPKGRLVCVFCEARAAVMKLPTADKLVGRHVHKGKCVAVRTCCEHLDNN